MIATQYGTTALSMPSEHGHLRVVEILLDRGADIEARENVIRLYSAVHIRMYLKYFAHKHVTV